MTRLHATGASPVALVLLTLLGCGGPAATDPPPARPANVPADAVELRLSAASLTVDGVEVDPRAALEVDLVDGIHAPLLEALAGGRPSAWITAPDDTPWMLVRKLLVTSDEAGIGSRWVSGTSGPAYGPSHKPAARFLPNCGPEGEPVEGVARRVSIEIFHGSDGNWVEASAHFSARSGSGAALGLPVSCWRGASCDQLGPMAATCAAAAGTTDVPGRVAIAGPIGCMLPIRKQPGDEAAWPAELAANLRGLGVTDRDEATLLVEANVPYSVVLAVMEGFTSAGLPPPSLGLPLVEGHGRPPVCTATIRDATTLDTAAARWFGAQLPKP